MSSKKERLLQWYSFCKWNIMQQTKIMLTKKCVITWETAYVTGSMKKRTITIFKNYIEKIRKVFF